jgi:hypothetical protein
MQSGYLHSKRIMAAKRERGFIMSNSTALAIGGIALIVTLIYYAAVIAAMVFSYIAWTHSIKKRIVAGDQFSAGDVFLWGLGWGCAASVVLPTIIYFFVQRAAINDTKARCAQILQFIKNQNYAASNPGYYPPQTPPRY